MAVKTHILLRTFRLVVNVHKMAFSSLLLAAMLLSGWHCGQHPENALSGKGTVPPGSKLLGNYLLKDGSSAALGEAADTASDGHASALTGEGEAIQVYSIEANLDVPWEIRYYKGDIWYSLQGGDVYRKTLATGAVHKVLSLPGVMRKRTMGSLGMAIDSAAGKTQVYFIYNTVVALPDRTAGARTKTIGQDAASRDSGFQTQLVRYDYNPLTDQLGHRQLVFAWPASTSHNGARILIGRDQDLFVTTGDLEDNNNAQDTASLNGKVLHMMKDGSIPAGNPFKGSYIWSYGHRNDQGICYGPGNQIFASEHGDAIEDEVNLIEPGKDYGWPLVEGRVDQPQEIHRVDSLGKKITEPLISWTPTIAPASIIYYKKGVIKAFENSLLLVTLKGNALYVLHLDSSGQKITGQDIYFEHFFGRLRSITLDPAGNVYIGTSNRDWNPGPGYPKTGDDHILMLTPYVADAAAGGLADTANFKPAYTVHTVNLNGSQASQNNRQKGADLFINYCSSCHKPDGNGIPGTFPPLKGNKVLDSVSTLIRILQNGRTGTHSIMGKTYTQAMPSFSFLTDSEMLDLTRYLHHALGGANGLPVNNQEAERHHASDKNSGDDATANEDSWLDLKRLHQLRKSK